MTNHRSGMCLTAVLLTAIALALPFNNATTAALLQTRDVPRNVETGLITGRVIRADTAEGVEGAKVQAIRSDLQSSVETTTDLNGRYRFADLPVGRYALRALKEGFVAGNGAESGPRLETRSIDVRPGQSLTADLALMKAGVIAGIVTNEYLQPQADVHVIPMRKSMSQGRVRFLPVRAGVQTNDRGEFRLFGLQPGIYYVLARPRSPNVGRDAAASRRGYAETYYPGTDDYKEAQRVKVGPGAEIAGLFVTLKPIALVTVSGIVNAATDVLPTSVTLRRVDAGSGRIVNIQPDGRFTIRSLARGEYRLRTQEVVGPGKKPLTYSATVVVGDEDVTNLSLEPVVMSRLTGRIILDPALRSNAKPPTVTVKLQPVEGWSVFREASAGHEKVNEDLSFEITTWPGTFVLNANALGTNATMRIVRLHGEDVTDRLEVREGHNLSGLEVELTKEAPQLQGQVTNSEGEGVADCVVIVFPQERSHRNMPRRLARLRPTQDGRFQSRSLPPGKYHAIAVWHVDVDAWDDPAFLDGLQEKAESVVLSEGLTSNVRLTLPTGRR